MRELMAGHDVSLEEYADKYLKGKPKKPIEPSEPAEPNEPTDRT